MWNPAIPDWRTRFENIKPCVEPCTECDISVSKLLSLETYVNFLKVSFSVSGKIVSKKSYHFGETWSRKKKPRFQFWSTFWSRTAAQQGVWTALWPLFLTFQTTNNKQQSLKLYFLKRFTLHSFTPPFCKLSWKKSWKHWKVGEVKQNRKLFHVWSAKNFSQAEVLFLGLKFTHLLFMACSLLIFQKF